MMIDSALSESQVSGETLSIKFIPLSAIKNLTGFLWNKNAKKHDLKSLIKSIETYGFIDPPKWDSNLNDGEGGLIYGNGRTEALVSALIEAQSNNEVAPRGIPTAIDSGEWCIPVKFGVDTDSETIAIAGAIDHNNLTLSGSDFDAVAVAEIWTEDYVALLSSIADLNVLPVSVSEDDLAQLLLYSDSSSESNGSEDSESDNDGENLPDSPVRMVQLFFNETTHPEFLELIEKCYAKYDVTNATDAVLEALRDLL